MKVHKHVFHAVKGLKLVWVSKDGVFDGVKGCSHNPSLKVVDLHALIEGIGAMLNELIVEIMLLDVLQHVGVKSEVLATLLISK
jgi:hypothetical protein